MECGTGYAARHKLTMVLATPELLCSYASSTATHTIRISSVSQKKTCHGLCTLYLLGTESIRYLTLNFSISNYNQTILYCVSQRPTQYLTSLAHINNAGIGKGFRALLGNPILTSSLGKGAKQSNGKPETHGQDLDSTQLNYASEKRENATLIMLARNSDVEGAVSSILSLEKQFNSRRKQPYPWVFLNEVPFSEEFKLRVSKAAAGEVRFGLIKAEEWYPPDWIDEKRIQAGKYRMGNASYSVPHYASTPYRNMCRYNSGVSSICCILIVGSCLTVDSTRSISSSMSYFRNTSGIGVLNLMSNFYVLLTETHFGTWSATTRNIHLFYLSGNTK